tara:strand:- start:67 stop:168 length:102 start_codon:yes stop_codon:yes gene_type:complete
MTPQNKRAIGWLIGFFVILNGGLIAMYYLSGAI